MVALIHHFFLAPLSLFRRPSAVSSSSPPSLQKSQGRCGRRPSQLPRPRLLLADSRLWLVRLLLRRTAATAQGVLLVVDDRLPLSSSVPQGSDGVPAVHNGEPPGPPSPPLRRSPGRPLLPERARHPARAPSTTAPAPTDPRLIASWSHGCTASSPSVCSTSPPLADQNAETNAPHLLIEFIQNGPSFLVLLLDQPPGRDLVLHQRTARDRVRQELESTPVVEPYRSPSLYVRGLLSPMGIAVKIISCGAGGASSMEQVMRLRVAGAAKDVMGVWLERCVGGERDVMESDRARLVERDGLIKSKRVENDLASNLPRPYGPEVADRVLAAIHSAVRT